MTNAVHETEVVVVGGGPVGLATSIGLSRQGVRHVLVEKHVGASIFPKARLVTTRSMELLRSWGLQEAVEHAGLPRASSLALCITETLSSPVFRREEARMMADAGQSPTYSLICSQDRLEVLLREAAEAAPEADVRFGVRARPPVEVPGGVEVGLEGGDRLHAEYVVAADGSRSPIRGALGIDVEGPPPLSHMISVMFRAPLAEIVAEHPSALYFINNDVVQCAVEVVDGDRWMLQLGYSPERGERPEDFTEEVCVANVRAAAGVADLSVELLGTMPWTQQAVVASTFRQGRVFLAGDAAHVATPQGGLGMNCGLGDTSNLVWKLAAVCRGAGSDALLDTYEQERLPIASWTVAESLRNAEITRDMMSGALLPAEAADLQAERRRAEGLVLGYSYDSAAVIADAETGAAPDYGTYRPLCRAGCRAPHVWLDDGRSTMDLWGPEFTVLVPSGSSVQAPARVRRVEVGQEVTSVYEMSGTASAVLVRPDGHVAWRSQEATDISAPLAMVLAAGGRS